VHRRPDAQGIDAAPALAFSSLADGGERGSYGLAILPSVDEKLLNNYVNSRDSRTFLFVVNIVKINRLSRTIYLFLQPNY
jgi:hypothetical protein